MLYASALLVGPAWLLQCVIFRFLSGRFALGFLQGLYFACQFLGGVLICLFAIGSCVILFLPFYSRLWRTVVFIGIVAMSLECMRISTDWSMAAYLFGTRMAVRVAGPRELVSEARDLLPGRGGLVPRQQCGRAIRELHPEWVMVGPSEVLIKRAGFAGTWVGIKVLAPGMKAKAHDVELAPGVYYSGE